MGALAEAFVAYAQPLLDQTDGSQEQMQEAFTISQLCYNLALLPEDQRETMLREVRPDLNMNDQEFNAFWHSIVEPMIQRHHEMFPSMHRRASTATAAGPSPSSPSPWAQPKAAAPAEAYPGTDRYAPCPCGSGEKYKFCCGKKRR
jgi:hypothetical protein